MKNVSRFTWSNLSGYGGVACYAVKNNGNLYGWGSGEVVKKAADSSSDKKRWKPKKLLENVYTLDGSAESSNMLALTNDGILWTWGKVPGDYGVWKTSKKWESHETLMYDGIVKVSEDVIAADTNGSTILFVKKNHSLWYQGGAPGSAYEESIKEPMKLTKNVSAVRTKEGQGIFVLKTNGYLYGTNYVYKKHFGKLHRMGKGFLKAD